MTACVRVHYKTCIARRTHCCALNPEQQHLMSQVKLRHGCDLQVRVSEQSVVVDQLCLGHQLPEGLPVLVRLVEHPMVEQVQA